MKMTTALFKPFPAGLLAILAIAISPPALSQEYGDVVMNRTAASMEKAGMKPVQFPHWFHRIRYKCKVCHEELFVMAAGANEVNMRGIMEGKFCGTCHNGKIAWEPIYCDRCHAGETQMVEKKGAETKLLLGSRP